MLEFKADKFKRFLGQAMSPKALKAGQQAGLESAKGYISQSPQQRIGFKRKAAYGVTFFSDAQRRGFFARLRSGEINVPYQRTGKFAQSWHIQGDTLKSTDPTAKHLVSDQQSRFAKLTGWRTIRQIIKDERANIHRAISEAIKKVLFT